MHTILRAYVTATSFLIDATDEQIDTRGSKKAVSSVWAEMPNLSADVIHIAEQLLDDPTLAAGEPSAKEEYWLKAVVDEVATASDYPPMTDEASWSSMARYTAWLAFCLKQSSNYATDPEYGKNGFEKIRELIEGSDDFEKSILVAAITEASAHIESTASVTSKDIVASYDDLVRGLA